MIRYAVRIAVNRCLPEARLVRGSRQSQTARGYGSCGDKRISRNVMERGASWHGTTRSGLVASRIWSREDPLFPAHQVSSRRQHNPSKHLQMLYYAGFKGGGVFVCSLVLRYKSTWHIGLSLLSRIVFLLHGRIEWYSKEMYIS